MILYKIIITILSIFILWWVMNHRVYNDPLPMNSSCGFLNPCKHFVEPLQDYGSKTKPMDKAPLAYESFPMYMKNPKMDNNDPSFQDIMINNETPYTPLNFNDNDNKKYYGTTEMQMDFKYFNNASNLTLYNVYNPPNPIEKESEQNKETNLIQNEETAIQSLKKVKSIKKIKSIKKVKKY